MTKIICPRCGGKHLENHPGGPLVFRHSLTCPLLPALDRTQAHESKNLAGQITRPATPAEAQLTRAVYPDHTGSALIQARRVTASIINREVSFFN